MLLFEREHTKSTINQYSNKIIIWEERLNIAKQEK